MNDIDRVHTAMAAALVRRKAGISLDDVAKALIAEIADIFEAPELDANNLLQGDSEVGTSVSMLT